MIYRGPGFLAVVWSGSSPIPLLSPLSRPKARPATYRKAEKERQLADERVGGGVGGVAKSYDGRESLVLCIYSILSEIEEEDVHVCVGEGWGGERGKGVTMGGMGGGGNPPETCPVSHKRVRGLVNLEGGGGPPPYTPKNNNIWKEKMLKLINWK